MFLVTKEFRFESAHFLPKYYGKCENLHGHSYRLQVTVKIPKLNDDGLAYDFVKLKKIVTEEVVDVFDHKLINDYVPIASAEHMALWIWDRIAPKIPIFQIQLWETDTCFVTYRGGEDFAS
jgi:6-pyruvoyltetrahydropterin/6-carboxytetrahydropterin synthase